MLRAAVLFLAVLATLTAAGPTAQAQRASDQDLIEAAKNGDTATVQRLLTEGADPNARNNYGLAALILAAAHGHTATVEALLAKGADPNAGAGTVGTALMWAALYGHPAIVQALLAQGADPNAKLSNGGTALMVAARYGQTAIVQALLAQGADPNAKLSNGWTALMGAASNGDPAIVQALIAKGADLYAENKAGETALGLAEKTGRQGVVQLLKRAEAGQRPAQPTPLAPEIVVDIERLPTARPMVQPNAYAVVIGIEQYTDLAPPEFAVRDATWVKEYLVHVIGYPEENIRLLLNEQATYSRIKSALETWLPNQDPNGSVFVYHSGHGAPDPTTGESYLVPTDGSPSDLKATGYPLKRLAAALSKLPAKEILVAIDSCFSGQPGTRSVIAKGTKPMVITTEGPWAALGDRGIVFTAGNQVSTVYQEKQHGLFTYFFLKGLQGAADLNGDGAVSVQELFTYLQPEVVKTARRQNVNQEPGLWPPPQSLGSRASRALAVLQR